MKARGGGRGPGAGPQSPVQVEVCLADSYVAHRLLRAQLPSAVARFGAVSTVITGCRSPVGSSKPSGRGSLCLRSSLQATWRELCYSSRGQEMRRSSNVAIFVILAGSAARCM